MCCVNSLATLCVLATLVTSVPTVVRGEPERYSRIARLSIPLPPLPLPYIWGFGYYESADSSQTTYPRRSPTYLRTDARPSPSASHPLSLARRSDDHTGVLAPASAQT